MGTAVTPSFVRTHPSYVIPDFILQYFQASGAMEILMGGDPQARLSEGDLYVYAKTLKLTTENTISQAHANQLPSVAVVAAQISTPTYLVRVRAEYDHHDQAAAGAWDLGLPEAMRMGMHQSIFQTLRDMLLYGVNSANGEGIVNSPGATTVSLPPDTNGNTTVVTYDNGQMAIFFLQQLANVKTRTNSFGMASRCVLLGPQRVLGQLELVNIVQLTQFQRDGAGVETSLGVAKSVAEKNGYSDFDWVYDDTLIGKGAGGTDLVILAMPELVKPKGNSFSTAIWQQLKPGIDGTNLMFTDMSAPREIYSPLAGGATDVISEIRATSGWNIRPEAVALISMQFQ